MISRWVGCRAANGYAGEGPAAPRLRRWFDVSSADIEAATAAAWCPFVSQIYADRGRMPDGADVPVHVSASSTRPGAVRAAVSGLASVGTPQSCVSVLGG